MSRRQSERNRNMQIAEYAADHFLECVALAARLNAIQHFSKNDSANTVELARELHVHAINLVGLGCNVFYEEDLPFLLKLILCSDGGSKQRQTTAVQDPFTTSADDGAQLGNRVRIQNPVHTAAHTCIECGPMHPVRIREILRNHRAVKCNQARVVHPGEQRRHIAIAHEYLWKLLQLVQSQIRKDIIRAVTTASTQDGADVVTLKHLLDVAGALIGRSGKVHIFVKNVVEVKRPVTSFAQILTSRFQQRTLNRTGRRNNTDRVAGLQGSRFYHGFLCGHQLDSNRKPSCHSRTNSNQRYIERDCHRMELSGSTEMLRHHFTIRAASKS